MLLFSPLRGNIGIYDWTLEDHDCELGEDEKVSPELSVLIDSARGCPPALARAKADVGSIPDIFSRKAFEAAVISRLELRLAEQREASDILLRVVKGVGYFLREGSFVWVVGYSEEEEVAIYVGWDFFLHSAPCQCFDLSREELRRRFR